MLTSLYINGILHAIDKRSNNQADFRQNYGSAAFYRELRTMQMDFGRQTGKTIAGLELLDYLDDSILITLNQAHARYLIRENPRLKDKIFHPVLYLHSVLRPHPIKAKYIILDESKYFLGKTMCGGKFDTLFYDNLERVGAEMIIKLGA